MSFHFIEQVPIYLSLITVLRLGPEFSGARKIRMEETLKNKDRSFILSHCPLSVSFSESGNVEREVSRYFIIFTYYPQESTITV